MLTLLFAGPLPVNAPECGGATLDDSLPSEWYIVFPVALVLVLCWALWANRYMANGEQGWPRLSWEVYPSTPGEDAEALACVLGEPQRFGNTLDPWLERTRVKAGRAALRRIAGRALEARG